MEYLKFRWICWTSLPGRSVGLQPVVSLISSSNRDGCRVPCGSWSCELIEIGYDVYLTQINIIYDDYGPQHDLRGCSCILSVVKLRCHIAFKQS